MRKDKEKKRERRVRKESKRNRKLRNRKQINEITSFVKMNRKDWY